MAIRDWLCKQKNAFTGKSRIYWVTAILTIVIGIIISELAAGIKVWIGIRASVYNQLSRLSPLPHGRLRTVLALIDDEEYWRGELAGRRPLRRDYLAKIIDNAIAADPSVLALDFKLRSPSPDGNPVDHPAYRVETDKLVEAVINAAKKCPVVLPRTVHVDSGGLVTIESAVYDARQIPRKNVFEGFINLPDEVQLGRVPLAELQGRDGRKVRSFAEVIVEANDPALPPLERREELPFGMFLPLPEFLTVRTADVIQQEESTKAKLHHRIVIIGGHWHEDGLGGESFVDLHNSPIGLVPGTLLHANYVESLIQSRLYWEIKRSWSILFEAIAAVIVVLVFALEVSWWLKLVGVVVAVVGLMFISLSSLFIFAVVFDFVIPVAAVVIHAVVAAVVESKQA